MTTVRRFIAPLGAAASLACGVAVAAPDCSAVPALTPLQKRIAAKAAEGKDALRGFIVIRQSIYQFDVLETMRAGQRHHEWLASCGYTVDTAPTARE